MMQRLDEPYVCVRACVLDSYVVLDFCVYVCALGFVYVCARLCSVLSVKQYSSAARIARFWAKPSEFRIRAVVHWGQSPGAGPHVTQ